MASARRNKAVCHLAVARDDRGDEGPAAAIRQHRRMTELAIGHQAGYRPKGLLFVKVGRTVRIGAVENCRRYKGAASKVLPVNRGASPPMMQRASPLNISHLARTSCFGRRLPAHPY